MKLCGRNVLRTIMRFIMSVLKKERKTYTVVIDESISQKHAKYARRAGLCLARIFDRRVVKVRNCRSFQIADTFDVDIQSSVKTVLVTRRGDVYVEV